MEFIPLVLALAASVPLPGQQAQTPAKHPAQIGHLAHASAPAPRSATPHHLEAGRK